MYQKKANRPFCTLELWLPIRNHPVGKKFKMLSKSIHLTGRQQFMEVLKNNEAYLR